MREFARVSAALLLCCILLARAAAQEAAELRVGHWIQVKGALDANGVFEAGEIEVLQPGSSEALTATIGEVHQGGGFTLLGVRVDVDARTVFEAVDRASLSGVRVKVTGRGRSDGSFFARRVAARDAGRDRIEGRVDALESENGTVRLSVVGFDVRIAAKSKLELAAPLDALKLAPARQSSLEAPQRDEDDRVRGTLRLGEDWVLGGLFEWEAQNRGDFDLDDSRPRDRLENTLSLRAELVWTPTDDALLLASYEHVEDWREEQTKPTEHTGIGHVKEAYGYFRDALLGWDVQVGRAQFHESRRWIFSRELDGVRFLRRWRGFSFDVSATTVFADGSPRDESTTNLMAFAGGGTSKRGYGVWILDRDDRDSSGETARHFGARAFGEWLPDTKMWADAAWLSGESAGRDVSGFGFDVGATWNPDFLGPVSLIGGYAFGTGDSTPLDQDSSTFRQTGFHDNKGKLESATSLRYYGELVDPELANLGILTLGVGVRLEKRTTLSLLAHAYTLDQAEDTLYGSNLRATPDGVHPEIGWEYDLVLGTKRWASWQLELVLGMFDPGAAFPGGSDAYLGAVQLKYRF